MGESGQAAVAGGVLIGIAAVLLMLALGRICGIAGIIGSLIESFQGRVEDLGWRAAFIAGLLLGPWLAVALGLPPPTIAIAAGWPAVLIGGLLVGFGVRLGSGCTSGHGVCGIARLSPRSLAATGLFMATGMAVVFLAGHVLGG